ncbi:hypothetical protein TBCH5v1_2052 [Thermococcus barophilus]|uniref:Peptidase M1 membrane alanine aminopeptidase domain-containing protein n=2 Tax=Thermococcus barophilus TaxID=55802 RepID=A0A0S1XDY9_THEBA|nr:hypothetical protein TBCH5v1_2052 [Thermococcus barophilus]
MNRRVRLPLILHQFSLFAGQFNNIRGNIESKNITIMVYFPKNGRMVVSPKDVLRWSEEVISSYVSLYSVIPSRVYYVINWNTGKSEGNGLKNGVILGEFGKEKVNKGLISHELAHSWFGYYADFKMLNEAFATFSDLYIRNAFDNSLEKNALKGKEIIANIFQNTPEHYYTLYFKGAFVFRSLQFVLGNETFFEGLRELLRECHNKECNLTDVQNVFEKVSGQDLDWFFREWFYTAKVPNYEIENLSLVQKSERYSLTFEIIDKNNFTMPIEVEVKTPTKSFIKKVWVNGTARVEFELNEKPTEIILDPNEWMVNQNKKYNIEGVEIIIE